MLESCSLLAATASLSLLLMLSNDKRNRGVSGRGRVDVVDWWWVQCEFMGCMYVCMIKYHMGVQVPRAVEKRIPMSTAPPPPTRIEVRRQPVGTSQLLVLLTFTSSGSCSTGSRALLRVEQQESQGLNFAPA